MKHLNFFGALALTLCQVCEVKAENSDPVSFPKSLIECAVVTPTFKQHCQISEGTFSAALILPSETLENDWKSVLNKLIQEEPDLVPHLRLQLRWTGPERCWQSRFFPLPLSVYVGDTLLDNLSTGKQQVDLPLLVPERHAGIWNTSTDSDLLPTLRTELRFNLGEAVSSLERSLRPVPPACDVQLLGVSMVFSEAALARTAQKKRQDEQILGRLLMKEQIVHTQALIGQQAVACIVWRQACQIRKHELDDDDAIESWSILSTASQQKIAELMEDAQLLPAPSTGVFRWQDGWHYFLHTVTRQSSRCDSQHFFIQEPSLQTLSPRQAQEERLLKNIADYAQDKDAYRAAAESLRLLDALSGAKSQEETIL